MCQVRNEAIMCLWGWIPPSVLPNIDCGITVYCLYYQVLFSYYSLLILIIINCLSINNVLINGYGQQTNNVLGSKGQSIIIFLNMIAIQRALLSAKKSRGLLGIQAYFCQMKANQPDPNDPVEKEVSSHTSSEIQEAENARNSYIQEFQARSRNVESYRITVDSLSEQIEQIDNAKRWAMNPFQKFIDWLTNKKKNEELIIQRLKKSIHNTKNNPEQWKEFVAEKEFVNLYRHRDFGSRLIEVTKMLGKVEITDTKNQKIREGVDLTLRMMNMILYKYGFTQFKPTPKEKFNKTLHEEVNRVRTKQPKDTIVKVVEDGWMYKEEVLIHAKVIVSE